MESNLFLPTREDQLKAQVIELRKRLAHANEEKEKLKREIMEEDIAYIATAKFSEEIRDTTREKASQLKDKQQQILSQLVEAVEARCVQELIGYYRLAGRTTFTFQRYRGIRLETFYGGTYFEPYYLLLLPKRSGLPDTPNDFTNYTISKDTLPNFIPLRQIADKLFPWDMDSFLRVIHDFLLAYVGRREQYETMRKLCDERDTLTSVVAPNESKKIINLVESVGNERYAVVELIYKNLAIDFPTEVVITENPPSSRTYAKEKDIFLKNRLPEAYNLAFNV
ncbi:hypothetical protein BDA99DRAFT_602191 [Phascolomyces articulosus]|uniref:Cenp-O kinetochore centromere component-domain-containing protein n=1 Tax=Phascolomyces articulosus TaxID=60185 RepID=A0AAD5PHM5_9FUNG|nr:hypothetical protein BDA99DRAFT_602191 [Phascolomyces articulosus]